MDKQVASKILDEAREKIAEHLYNDSTQYEYEWSYVKEKQPSLLQMFLGKANHVLALSGTTDIECPTCQGTRMWGGPGINDECDDCEGKGVVKHKWEIGVHLENGELPECPYPIDVAGSSRGWKQCTQDMLNEKWVKEVRQVVE